MKDSSKAIVTLVVIFVTVASTVTFGLGQLWLVELEAALGTANNALSTAGAAQSLAQQATVAAAEAQQVGDAAQMCCIETSDKLDRMFQRSMKP